MTLGTLTLGPRAHLSRELQPVLHQELALSPAVDLGSGCSSPRSPGERERGSGRARSWSRHFSCRPGRKANS